MISSHAVTRCRDVTYLTSGPSDIHFSLNVAGEMVQHYALVHSSKHGNDRSLIYYIFHADRTSGIKVAADSSACASNVTNQFLMFCSAVNKANRNISQ